MDGTDKEGNEVLSEDDEEYDDEYGSEDEVELNEEQLAALRERAANGELDDDEDYDDEEDDGEEYDEEDGEDYDEEDDENEDAAGAKRGAPSNGDGGANKRKK